MIISTLFSLFTKFESIVIGISFASCTFNNLIILYYRKGRIPIRKTGILSVIFLKLHIFHLQCIRKFKVRQINSIGEIPSYNIFLGDVIN